MYIYQIMSKCQKIYNLIKPSKTNTSSSCCQVARLPAWTRVTASSCRGAFNAIGIEATEQVRRCTAHGSQTRNS